MLADPEFSRVAIDQLARVSVDLDDDATLSVEDIIARCESAHRSADDAEQDSSGGTALHQTADMHRFARLLDAAETAGYIQLSEWSELRRLRRVLLEMHVRDSTSLSPQESTWLAAFAERAGQNSTGDLVDATGAFYVFGAYLQLLRSIKASTQCIRFIRFGAKHWGGAAEFLQSARHFAIALAGAGHHSGHLTGGLEYLSYLGQLTYLLRRLGESSELIDKMIIGAQWSHVAHSARQQFGAWATLTASWNHEELLPFVDSEGLWVRPTRSDLERLGLLPDATHEDETLDSERSQLFEAVLELRRSAPRRELQAEMDWLRGMYESVSDAQRVAISARLGQIEQALAPMATSYFFPRLK